MENLLFESIRNILTAEEVQWEEKKMMGGITFMVDDKMCFGTYKGGLLCRIDPKDKEDLLKNEYASSVYQAGREMKGYVFLESPAYESRQGLEFWIKKCLVFNPKARGSKRKKLE
ncbi:MAG: TfoX/Sxy family protein [Fulvivirga sp.]|uniref:TfoX/Sxy family protein n=1 Tax=Fulvivirga sp. TaxID=1931237 RepID=UPI0032EFF038